MRSIAFFLAFLLFSTPLARSQSLADLWPHQDGSSWTYQGNVQSLVSPLVTFTGRLTFDGSATMAPGVEVQNLIGLIDGQPAASWTAAPQGLPTLERRLWLVRPELRDALLARADKRRVTMWPALLLGPAETIDGVGHRQTGAHIGLWRDALGDWAWWYLTDTPVAGASFTLQLIPDLASDVFLHGTVRGTSETVTTPAGSWSNAVVVDYVVDQGAGLIVDETGNVVGTATSETSGWVAFVPAVGPVASSEDFSYVSVDCPDGCPEEDLIGVPLSHVDLALTTGPVAVENRSWSALKSRW